MKPIMAIVQLLVAPALSSAQDPDLGIRAVTLLERANAVSLTPVFGTLSKWMRFARLIPALGRRKAPSPAWLFKAFDGRRRRNSATIMSPIFGQATLWQPLGRTQWLLPKLSP
jgi:hypothetical protein